MHLFGRFQIPLAAWKQPPPSLGQCAAVTNTSNHILQQPSGTVVIVNVVGSDWGNRLVATELGKILQPAFVVSVIRSIDGKREPISQRAMKLIEIPFECDRRIFRMGRK